MSEQESPQGDRAPRVPVKRRVSDESGAAMLVVAMSVVVVFGMAALAIDGGFLFVEKRQAQNAADHAALGAAWAGCNFADPTPETRLLLLKGR